jgi:hypothetical protein
VILGDQLFQRDRKQAGLAAGLSLDVGHNEKCSVSFDTEHFLRALRRLLGFHTAWKGGFFMTEIFDLDTVWRKALEMSLIVDIMRISSKKVLYG